MSPTVAVAPAVPRLHLVPPEDLPTGWRQFGRLTPPGRTAVLAALDALTAAEKLRSLGAAHQALRTPSVVAVVSDSAAAESADSAAHDAYCRVVRVRGQAATVFMGAVVQTYRGLIRDLTRNASSLAPEDWIRLSAALDSILAAALGRPATDRPSTSHPEASGTSPADPLRRWIFGHHVFLVLIQALVVALHQLATALASPYGDNVDRAFDHASQLWKGAAVAFRFTAGFSPAEYGDVVRPSMMPPAAPPGMSGLLSSDHAYLVARMAALKPRLISLDPIHLPAYQRFRAAFAGAYDAHKFVCQRFTGAHEPSLLMPAKADMPAVEVLNRFKRSRLGLLPEPSAPGEAAE